MLCYLLKINIKEAISALYFCSPLSSFHLFISYTQQETPQGKPTQAMPIMASSSLPSFLQIPTFSQKLTTSQNNLHFAVSKRDKELSSSPSHNILQKSLPLAASLAILLWSTPGRTPSIPL